MRALPVLVALAIVLSPLAGGAGALAPPDTARPVVESIDGTPSYLGIPDDQVQYAERETVRFEVAGAVGVGAERLRTGSKVEAFLVRYENAENKRLVVEQELNDLANETQDLRARQVEVTRQYNAGELTGRQYLVELAVLTARAQAHRDLAQALDSRAPPALGPAPERLEYELDAFIGPVRSRLLATVRGDANAPHRFYLETSSSGFAIATIDDGRYFREAYLNDARTGSGGWADHREAQDAFFNTFYPWATNNGNIGFYGYGEIYRYRSTYAHGSLFAFADTDSGQVFAEFQSKVLSDAPVAVAGTNETERATVEVGLTHRGGQLRVSVTNPDSDAPMDQPIYVNGEFVGRTGDDGTLYALTPRGRVNTTAVAGGDPIVVITGDTGPTGG